MAAGNRARGGPQTIPADLSAGFSLTEMLIVLGIASILLTMAVPSFRTLIQNQQVTTAANDLFAAIALARSEAIKRGTPVNLAAMDVRSNWQNGWVVFVDNNDNGERDTGDETIFERGALSGGITIAPGFSGSVLKYLTFNGVGRIRTDSNNQALGSFSFKMDGETRRKVMINFLGRPRVCNPATDKKSC
jgi:type IV fimbrial biogenesis protein FimT